MQIYTYNIYEYIFTLYIYLHYIYLHYILYIDVIMNYFKRHAIDGGA